nr:RNA-directed DNA polymerase, eukaryota, nucleotide-binding alpha-beta plait domain protein [Tanacetum cinerariifolium]
MNSGNNKDSFASILKEGTQKHLSPDHSKPTLVSHDLCLKERGFSMSLMGKVKEVSAIHNLNIILSKEGKVHWIHAKELDAWVPKNFYEDDNDSSNDKSNDFSNVEKVSKSSCMKGTNLVHENVQNTNCEDTPQSNDPFNIYKLLQKKNVTIPKSKDFDPTYPPGFTPINKNHNKGYVTVYANDQVKSTPNMNLYSCRNVESTSQRTTSIPISRGSILDVMDDLVKFGQTMGYNMKGSLKNIAEIIGAQGDINVIR